MKESRKRADDFGTGDGRWDDENEPRLGVDPENEENIDNEKEFVEDFVDNARNIAFAAICSGK